MSSYHHVATTNTSYVCSVTHSLLPHTTDEKHTHTHTHDNTNTDDKQHYTHKKTDTTHIHHRQYTHTHTHNTNTVHSLADCQVRSELPNNSLSITMTHLHFPLYKVKHHHFCRTRCFGFSIAEENETCVHPLQKSNV